MVMVYQFDSVTFNSDSSPYKMGLNLREHQGWGIETTVRQRTNQSGVREQMSVNPRQLPLTITRNPHYTSTPKTGAEFRQDMLKLFAPMKGERILVGLHEDESTQVYAIVDIMSMNFLGQTNEVAELQVIAETTDPIWRSVDIYTTTTNGGDYAALPRMVVTAGASCTRISYAVTDQTGRGISGYPVKLPQSLNDSDWVFCRGRAIPTNDSGWVLVDVPKNPLSSGSAPSTTLDVFSNSGIPNPLFNTLDLGGLNPGDSNNDQWIFHTWNVSDNPNGSGTAKAIKIGATYSSVSYGIATETQAELQIGVDGTDKYDRQYDAVGFTSGVEMASIQVDLTATGCADVRIFIKKLPKNGWWINAATAECELQDIFIQPADVNHVTLTLNDNYDLANAIACCIGIEPMRSIEQQASKTSEDGSVTWEGQGYQRATGILNFTGNVTLFLSNAPSVSAISSVTAQVIHEQVIINNDTGHKIFIKRSFAVGDLIIDCLHKTVHYSTGRGYADWRPTDPDNIFLLREGTNDVDTGSLSVAWEYEQRYVL